MKPHGSIYKAAAVTGIGRMNVVDLPAARAAAVDELVGQHADPWGLGFDLEGLEVQLRDAERYGQGVIVVVTLGEVNTVSFSAFSSD